MDTKNTHNDGPNGDTDNDKLLEGLKEQMRPQDYAIDRIGRHIGKCTKLKCFRRGYCYTSANDTVERRVIFFHISLPAIGVRYGYKEHDLDPHIEMTKTQNKG